MPAGEKDERPRKKRAREMAITVTYSAPETPYVSLRETRKKRKEKVGVITHNIGSLAFWMFYMGIYGIVRVFEHAEPDERDSLTSFLFCNEVMQPTIRFCLQEFYVFVMELQVAAYTGAARTLRCILETAVDACEFQSSEKRPTLGVLLKEYDLVKQAPDKAKKMTNFMMKHNASVSFLERYRIYEEIKRIAPSFKELVNRLNSREFFKEDPYVHRSLKATYERLSDYVHPSSEKIESLMMKSEFQLIPRFSPKTFDVIYELGIKILDMVQFLYVKSISQFYGHKSAKSFIKDLAKSMEAEPEFVDSLAKLPHLAKLTKGVTWKIRKEAKK